MAVDAETKARVTREAAVEKLKVLGVTDLDHPPDGIVDVYAPISGVIIEQNVTAGAGVKTLDNSPNLFTIANLDTVWVMCDVYENDFPFVRLGDYADVRLNAYPDKVFKGRDQQHRTHPRPHYPHREGEAGDAEPGTHAHRHVRHRHLLRPRAGDARGRPGDRDPPPP